MPDHLLAMADQLEGLVQEALRIWRSGGDAMWGIAAIALVIFALGLHVHLRLREKGFTSVREETWRRWIESPRERRGPIGAMLDVLTEARTIAESTRLFEQIQRAETRPFERDLRVMKVCVSAAPLVGLLGTVIGMLATFGALSAGSGGDKTMGLIAEGISQALITTETGLVVALPGLFLQYQLRRKFERYKAFLAHLESVCNQTLYKQLCRRRGASLPYALRRVQPALERQAAS